MLLHCDCLLNELTEYGNNNDRHFAKQDIGYCKVQCWGRMKCHYITYIVLLCKGSFDRTSQRSTLE